MAVHDISDPLLEIAKACNYCKAKVRALQRARFVASGARC